ncbi:hypothetical protein [Paenalcaligenes sp. Me131]|uniref:hypothetical protein n=1 Tax=Paenalcaligenes sp. Me131 TaxID=3392636 RepID=UPI003D2AD217
MARALLGVMNKAPQLQTNVQSQSAASSTRSKLDAVALKARLRQKRSTAYIEAMTTLDAGGHVHSQTQTQALVDAMHAEFPDVQIEGLPIGIISKCYLGEPFEVHTLDYVGQIIQHYKKGAPLPKGMEAARSLARLPHYSFIEVYTDKLITVSQSGQTAIIDL